ncbi:MAG: hypothetical protein AAF639_32720 [Chloroflexota bacterium]
MLTDFQKKKLTHLFHLQDNDNNGLLERDDYEQVMVKIGELYEYAPDSPEYTNLYPVYMQLWEGLRQVADTNQDGCVSLDEFMNAYDVMLADKEAFMSNMHDICAMWYKMADRNGDGLLDPEELFLNQSTVNVDEVASRASFPHMDRSGRGGILLEEMVINMEEFYYSDDPAAPGNWAVGPLPA